jgi:hypothetical protein
MGILELQEARRHFSRTRPECGRSLSFDRKVGAYGRRGKDSSQFPHTRRANPSRGRCAACAIRTPGPKIYCDKRARPYPFDSTDDTTPYSFSIVVAAFAASRDGNSGWITGPHIYAKWTTRGDLGTAPRSHSGYQPPCGSKPLSQELSMLRSRTLP